METLVCADCAERKDWGYGSEKPRKRGSVKLDGTLRYAQDDTIDIAVASLPYPSKQPPHSSQQRARMGHPTASASSIPTFADVGHPTAQDDILG